MPNPNPKACSTNAHNEAVFHITENELKTARRCQDVEAQATPEQKLPQQYACALVGDALSGAHLVALLLKPLEHMVTAKELQLQAVDYKATLCHGGRGPLRS